MKIEFKGSIPNVQSALKFGGDAARVTFEVPAQEVGKAVALIALKETALKITVEVDSESLSESKDLTKNGSTEAKRRTARRPTAVDSR